MKIKFSVDHSNKPVLPRSESRESRTSGRRRSWRPTRACPTRTENISDHNPEIVLEI